MGAQLSPIVHAVLTGLIAASWTLIGLLTARALSARYGLHPPARATTTAAALITGLIRRRRPATETAPTQEHYELAARPVGQR